MNTAFNSALKQSTSIRKDLSTLSNPSFANTDPSAAAASALTPAALGSLSASLTAFSRTIDEYNGLAKQELNTAKQEKAYERIRNFRTELSEFRTQFDSLKAARDDAVHTQNRTELLGRRPFAANTPENPYANASVPTASGYGMAAGVTRHARSQSGAEGGLGMGGNDVTREGHALREQNFFNSTNSALDEYIARGQAVLGDLGAQRDMLKNTQKRLYSVGNTLGISGDTIRMIERRAMQDKWIFWGGVIIFVLFCWLVLHYLR
ncbi:V-snare-domain-containing protein [Thozetella sp. PMI_491]|nr:V-snare-domain-containing protein [Thozetella sp. PMI_491]